MNRLAWFDGSLRQRCKVAFFFFLVVLFGINHLILGHFNILTFITEWLDCWKSTYQDKSSLIPRAILLNLLITFALHTFLMFFGKRTKLIRLIRLVWIRVLRKSTFLLPSIVSEGIIEESAFGRQDEPQIHMTALIIVKLIWGCRGVIIIIGTALIGV